MEPYYAAAIPAVIIALIGLFKITHMTCKSDCMKGIVELEFDPTPQNTPTNSVTNVTPVSIPEREEANAIVPTVSTDELPVISTEEELKKYTSNKKKLDE